MRWLDKIRLRVRSLLQKPAVDRELDEEIRFHLERQIQQNIAAGMQPEEALRAARIEFGAAPSFQEECREVRGVTLLHDVARDARIALRTLRKNPGFAAVTILTLALVIGANSAIFSAIYTLVFRRLPYKDPNQLAMIWDSNHHTGADHITVMTGSFPILHEQTKSFSGMAAFVGGFSGGMFQERIWGTDEPVNDIGCTSEFFTILGVSPFVGQSFDPHQDINNDLTYPPRRPPAALLSYSFWQRHYGASPEAIGKTLSLNFAGERGDYLIVGVMPASFDFPYPLRPTKPDFWFQMGIQTSTFTPGNLLQVVARLQPWANLRTAQAELDTIADGIRREHAKYYANEYVTAFPLQSELIRDGRPILWALLTALSFVLLIGCANIGNLMLMRAVSREKEMAVRVALGAGKPALLRQMLAETTLLSLGGGALGFLLAHWSLRVIVARIPASIYIPRANSMALESGVLACCVGASVIAAALFSLVPSLRLARPDLNRVINAASAAPDRPAISIFRRPGSLLLISEVSLAIVLLTGTVLLAKSLKRLIDVNLHFQPEHLLVMDWSFSNAFFLAHQDPEPLFAAAYPQLMQEVEGMSGVTSVAFADGFPFGKGPTTQQFKAEGGGVAIAQDYQPAESHVVTPSFFEMMGMSLGRGRWIADSDGPKALPVAVINQAMAERYWPGAEPLGQRIQPYFRDTDKRISYVIVGIVHEPQRFGNGGTPRPAVYLASAQVPLGRATILVRTTADPRSLADPLRNAALNLAPGQMFVSQVHTGDDLISESSARSRITVILLASFAGLALVLGMIGIYGLISYYTARRTREIGIRMALGATPLKVFRLVLKEGMSLVSIGLALGLIFGYGFGKSLANLLYATSPGDFVSFAVAAAVFGVVAFAACYIPARRATRVDPMAALRAE